MLALSGVGMVSLLGGAGGVQVPLASMLGSDIHAAWLAHQPVVAPVSSSAASGAPSLARAPAHELAQVSAAGTAPPAPAAAGTSAASNSAGLTDDGKVILNLASTEDLRRLPGVGQKRAEAILALRTRLGRFKQVSDLLRVKGIGVRGLKKIMPKVVLDAPKPAV